MRNNYSSLKHAVRMSQKDKPFNLQRSTETLRPIPRMKKFFLFPKQLLKEVLRSLQREFGKHPGFTKTTFVSSEKFNYPNMAQLVREWDM